MRYVALAAKIIGLMLLPSLAMAQSQSAMWKDMSLASRVAYLRGFQNGIVVAEADRVARDVSLSNQCGSVVPIVTSSLCDVITPENEASIIQGVDAIYSDDRNISFSIKAALTIVALEIGGATPESIEAMKVKCRQANLEQPGGDYMATILVMWEKTLRRAAAD